MENLPTQFMPGCCYNSVAMQIVNEVTFSIVRYWNERSWIIHKNIMITVSVFRLPLNFLKKCTQDHYAVLQIYIFLTFNTWKETKNDKNPTTQCALGRKQESSGAPNKQLVSEWSHQISGSILPQSASQTETDSGPVKSVRLVFKPCKTRCWITLSSEKRFARSVTSTHQTSSTTSDVYARRAGLHTVL